MARGSQNIFSEEKIGQLRSEYTIFAIRASLVSDTKFKMSSERFPPIKPSDLSVEQKEAYDYLSQSAAKFFGDV